MMIGEIVKYFSVENGFDIVISNPPYFQYSGKNKDKISELKKVPQLMVAFKGKLNAYKLFLAKSINAFISKHGITNFIIQNTFLADKSDCLLRKQIIENHNIIKIDSFPERDNKNKRVFKNVKMSVCIILIKNKFVSEKTFFRLNVWNDKCFKDGFTVDFTPFEIKMLFSDSFIIPSVSKSEKDIALKIIPQKNTSIKCLEGELNMTFCKKYFTDNKKYPMILRGSSIQKYFYTDKLSQGKTEYLDENNYYTNNKQSYKATHNKHERLAMQGITGVNAEKRLVATIVPKGKYLANSCNYILLSEKFKLKYLLALINSKLMNWFFKLFSTNSNVNCYEVNNLPLKFQSNMCNDIVVKVDKIIKYKNNSLYANTIILENEIDKLVYQLYGLTDNEIKIIGGGTT